MKNRLLGWQNYFYPTPFQFFVFVRTYVIVSRFGPNLKKWRMCVLINRGSYITWSMKRHSDMCLIVGRDRKSVKEMFGITWCKNATNGKNATNAKYITWLLIHLKYTWTLSYLSVNINTLSDTLTFTELLKSVLDLKVIKMIINTTTLLAINARIWLQRLIQEI